MKDSLRCPECGNTRIKASYLVDIQSYDIWCFRCGFFEVPEEKLARIIKDKAYGYKTKKLSSIVQNTVTKKVISPQDDYVPRRITHINK
jgi:predicted nucleic-acid-binding Zn-ribbon protein